NYKTEKIFCLFRDKIEQSFYYDADTIKALSDKEHEGVIRIDDIILIRSDLERNYEYCFTVCCFQDAKPVTVGYLFWGSYNPMRQDVYFKFENERLYDTKELPIDHIASTLKLQRSKLPCVDLAMDFNFNIIDKIYALEEHRDIDVIILNKKRNKTEYIAEQLNKSTGTLINRHKYKGFDIRAKDKNHKLMLCAYDKTLEINTESHKHYITKAEGFDNIYRLEVRASRNHLHTTLEALNITNEEFVTSLINKDDEVLIRVWKHLFSRILRFRKSGKRESEDIIDILFADNISKRTKRKPVIANIKSLLHKARNIAELCFYSLKDIA
ncbi:MAG: hypothetical protein K2K94_05070, partial [Muribaculaceae bacterium]|nr:hypothetical protein [Muribaculaceae bacterium]